MNFLRTRLTLMGALLALPLAQLSGCNAKEREYAPVGGEGGTGGSGGSGGSTAGKGGKAGSGGTTGRAGTGGEGGEGGEGNTGASGGDDNGGSSGRGSGGSSGEGGDGGSQSSGGSSGEGGEGGTGNAGTGGNAGTSGGAGEGGDGGTSGGPAGGSAGTSGGGTGGSGAGTGGNGGVGGSQACVPTGSEVCADGVDNDCDGSTDCLTPIGNFPEPNGAAAGEHVEYRFQTPHATATFECRSVRGNVPGGTWGACPRRVGASIYPFNDTVSSNAANNGLYATEVRLSFPNGSKSNVFSRLVYIHSSLVTATRCNPPVVDQAYFDAARGRLQAAGAFVDSTIRAPFVSIDFDPPVDSRYYVSSSDGTINLSSLRHRFTFSSDKQLMLITRNYTSRLGSYGCAAMEKRVHTQPGSWVFSGTMTYQLCTGLVMNKKGAGFCLNGSTGTVVPAEHVRLDRGVQVQAPNYSPEADNFAWRKLRAENANGHNVVFSPKCDDAGCSTTSTVLFLPDKQYFSYWRD